MPLPSDPITIDSLQDVTFDPLDVDHRTIEMLETRVLMLANVASQVQVLMPELIDRSAAANAALDKGKSILRWTLREGRDCRDILKSMRP